jgi:hypothetical protein
VESKLGHYQQNGSGLFVARPQADAAWLPDLSAPRTVEAPRKLCPVCGFRFKGRGWDGIDAHWRARHEADLPYERAWPLIRSGRYEFRALR